MAHTALGRSSLAACDPRRRQVHLRGTLDDSQILHSIWFHTPEHGMQQLREQQLEKHVAAPEFRWLRRRLALVTFHFARARHDDALHRLGGHAQILGKNAESEQDEQG
jgi:hypothetical protein